MNQSDAPTWVAGGTYDLPNDDVEHERLDAQARGLYALMGNRHIHAPIPSDATLLVDSGCGTGIVSVMMASENPQAQVIGVDLSPVPNIHEKPVNLQYLQGDIMELAGKTPQLQLGSADLVYSRLLICGLRGNKWQSYVGACASLLKPGGYLNMVDIIWRLYKVEDPQRPLETRKEIHEEWMDTIRVVAAEKGFDFDAGPNLEKYMTGAGLEDVQVREFPWPLGPWLGNFHPECQMMGRLPGEFGQGRGYAAVVGRLLEGRLPAEEVRRLQQQASDCMDSPGNIQVFYAVTGRKSAK